MNQKQSAPKQLEFQGLGRRSAVAAFDGGTISSEGGALLLRELDFAREWLMRWCEDHRVEYLFGLARNTRLRRAIGKAARRTRGSW